MTSIASICVYCGSSVGRPPGHAAAAHALGAEIAARGITLVYGGGRVGMMGLVADAAIAGGGRVVGVIPAHLKDREKGHTGLSELVVVDGMHARKQRMFELADAVVVMPGGLGTLDEAFEMITWRQLGLHDKAVILANIDSYWQPFLDLVDATIAAGYARPSVRGLFTVAASIEEVFTQLGRAPTPKATARPERL